jgi:hypothetical protein
MSEFPVTVSQEAEVTREVLPTAATTRAVAARRATAVVLPVGAGLKVSNNPVPVSVTQE